MKTTLVLGAALLAGSAFAQNYGGNTYGGSGGTNYGGQTYGGSGVGSVATADPGSQHMFEFNIDSALRGALSFDKNKVNGASSSNDTNWDLSFNYFYGVTRLIQAGFRFNYFSGVKA